MSAIVHQPPTLQSASASRNVGSWNNAPARASASGPCSSLPSLAAKATHAMPFCTKTTLFGTELSPLCTEFPVLVWVERLAAALLAPYAVWVTFAIALNWAIWRLN